MVDHADQAVVVKRLDAYTVVFELVQPYAAAERRLQPGDSSTAPAGKAYQEGKGGTGLGLGSSPGEIAGLVLFD